MTRSRALPFLLVLSIVVPAAPARAGATALVRIVDMDLRPAALTGLSTNPNDPALSHPVVWRNDDNVDHDLFFPREVLYYAFPPRLDPDDESDPLHLKFASSFPYLCSLHDSMSGTLRVRPALYEPGNPGNYAVTNGPHGEAVLRLANRPVPDGLAFSVQRKKDDGTWRDIETTVTAQKIVVSPNDPGVYRFRVRIRHTLSGDSEDWSPPSRTLTIS